MKRLLALLLTLVLLAFSAGCSNPADTESSAAGTSNITAEASSEESSSDAASSEGESLPPRDWFTTGDIEITKAEIEEIVSQEYVKPKNVIFMIADGMGPNDIILAEQFADGRFDFGLVLNQIPNDGMAHTRSANAAVTDSAASATALATGTKTNNGMIGKAPNGQDLKNISEIARENNKKIGIVTSDVVTGATPTSFGVHNVSRSNEAAMANSFVEFAPDVLIGQGYSAFMKALTPENEAAVENFLVSRYFWKMNETLNTDVGITKPLLGFVDPFTTLQPVNTLANITEAAINRLENENGFFLMVECAGTDKGGHNNDMQSKLSSVITFDRAVAVVLKYMKENPDTLLIITSDHETGGVQIPPEGEEPSNDNFTTGDHTGVDVRVFSVGYGSEYFKDASVDNTDIAKFAISAVKGELE